MAEDQPTSEDIAAYEAQVGPAQTQAVNPIRDLSAEDLAALAVEDKTFSIPEAFRSQPELHSDPAIVQKAADALNQVKQRGFNLQDLPTVPEAGKTLYGAAKGFGKQLWNYANVAGNIVAGSIAEMTGQEGLAGGYAEDISSRLAQNIAGTEEAMTGLSQLGEKAIGKAARFTGLAKGYSEFTPEEKVADLFADVGKAETSQQRLTGAGAFTAVVTGGTGAESLKQAGVTPEQVGELAAGDPFSFYLFGKGAALAGGAVGAVTPAAIKAIPGAIGAVAAKAAPAIGGRIVEAAGKTAEVGAKGVQAAGRVASVVGPIAGGIGALTGADIATAGLGGLVTGTGGVALRRVGQLIEPAAQNLTKIGQQIAGKIPVTSATAQLGRDVLQALPGAVGEVAKGAALDLGLAVTTAETPQETQGAVGFGTALGALGGAARLGGHILSGQLIAPRAYGADRAVPSSGQFPTFDAMHGDAVKAAPPGVKTRLNAIRQFVQGAAPGTDVFLAKDSAAIESALKSAGLSDSAAKAWSEQEGFFTTDLPGKNGQPRRVMVMRNVDTAPHESMHAIQDVLGEEANRAIDKIVQDAYADQWQAEGQRYADRLGNNADKTWQEAVLDASGWGLDEAKEKIYRDIYNRISGETGAIPAPGAVEEMAKAAFGKIMDEAVANNPHLDPNAIAAHAWREILTPEEASAAANRYIARELAAENFDALFKHTGPSLTVAGSLPAKLANIVGGLLSAVGGEPLAGRTSEFGNVALKTPVVEAVRKAAGGERPVVEPAAKLPLPKVGPLSADRAVEDARTLANEAPTDIPVGGTKSPRELLGQIAEAIATQDGVKINYLSAPDEPAAATTSNRDTRRAIIETFRTMPPEARALWEKTFFPEKVTRTKSGKYQIQGWAPEVFAANAHKMAKFLTEAPEAAALVPYEVDLATGSFTADAWQKLYADTQTFVANQMRGATGAGEPLVVPKSVTEAGGYAPQVRPGAEVLDQTKADFINTLFNFRLPDTPRIQTGRLPLNVIGQEVSVATKPGRVEVPVRARGEFTGEEAVRQGIEGRPILEVNPLRNQLEAAAAKAGKPMPAMIEAIQKLNLENIKEIQGAPEQPQFRGNTLTLTAGFQPEIQQARPAEREWRISGQLRGAKKQITVTAPDMAAARKQAESQGMRVSNVEAGNKMANAMFQPATASGRSLEEQGYEVRHVGGPANPGISILKDGAPVGDISAVRKSPTEADIAMVHVDKAFRGKGISEILYREIGKRLQDEGVDNVTGMVVDPRALASRSKVFPDTAIESVAEFPGGQQSFEVRSLIPAGAQFSPVEIANRVENFSPDEFRSWVNSINGKFTQAAWDIGRAAPTQEFVDSLRQRYDTLGKKSSDLLASIKNADIDTKMAALNDISALASQAQFFREAHEAATGEASAGQALRKADPDYQPPFPPSEAQGQFAPKRKLHIAQSGSREGYERLIEEMPFISHSVPEYFQAAQKLNEGFSGAEWSALPYSEQKIINAILRYEGAQNQETPKNPKYGIAGLPGYGFKEPVVKYAGVSASKKEWNGVAKKLIEDADIAWFKGVGGTEAIKEVAKKISDSVITPENLDSQTRRDKAIANELFSLKQSGQLDEAVPYEPLSKEMLSTISLARPEISMRASQKGYSPVETEASAKKRIAETDYSKYNTEPKKEPVARIVHDYEFLPPKAGFSKAWILPSGLPVQLGGTWHHQWLSEHPEVAAKYKLDVPKFEGGDAEGVREQALKAGFGRVNYAQNSGTLTVEARAKDWRKIKPSIERMVESNLDNIDNMTVHLLDESAAKVVDSQSAKLFNYDDAEKLQHLPFITEGEVRGQFSPESTKQSDEFFKVQDLVRPSKENLPTFDQFEKPEMPYFAPTWVLRDGKVHFGKGGLFHDEVVEGFEQLTDAVTTKPGEESSNANDDYAAALKTADKFQNDTGAMRIATFDSVKDLLDSDGDVGISISKAPSESQIKYFQDFLKLWGRHLNSVAVDITDADGNIAVGKVFNMPQDRGALQRFIRNPFQAEEPGAQFNPAAQQEQLLNVQKDERRAQTLLSREITRQKQQYPEALPLQYKTDEETGAITLGADGKPTPVGIPYGLSDTPLAKQAVKNKRGDAREAAIVDAYAEKIKSTYEAAKTNPEIAAGANWYSLAREKLSKLFGDDTKFFTELLGATSAQTDVPTNFRNSIEAYNNFKAGKYDDQIRKYREGKEIWETGDLGLESGEKSLAEWLSDAGLAPDATRAAWLKWWIDHNDLKPTKSNGKLFGANSDAVLKVLDGSWRESVQGPKTPNFAGNLSGDSFEATIDIWAARLLHRLGNDGNAKRWRILPLNEIGGRDPDFFLGQKAFRKAGEDLGISPDSLQAVMWFAEKDHWEKNGWTNRAGKEKSDFNTLLDRTTRGGEGGKLRLSPEDIVKRSAADTQQQQQLQFQPRIAEKNERPITAAIRLKNGKIYEGKNHADAAREAELYGEDPRDVDQADSGFVTNLERYISRKAASKMTGVVGEFDSSYLSQLDKNGKIQFQPGEATKHARGGKPAFVPMSQNEADRIADAIYVAEGGAKAKKPYGILSVSVKDAAEGRKVALNTIRNNYRRWYDAGQPGDYLEFLARRYAPTKNATNDPSGLNRNWLKNVRAKLAMPR